MIECDQRPGYPPDGAVRADRRPYDPLWPAPAWPSRKLSDAELACLAVAQVLPGARSEHHWLRMCYARLGHLFPYLPRQPGYHKRLKAAAPLDRHACLVPGDVQARHADPPLLGYAEDAQVEQRMWRAQRASAFAT